MTRDEAQQRRMEILYHGAQMDERLVRKIAQDVVAAYPHGNSYAVRLPYMPPTRFTADPSPYVAFLELLVWVPGGGSFAEQMVVEDQLRAQINEIRAGGA